MNIAGNVRTAGAREAAEWVAYCNAPENVPNIGYDRDASPATANAAR